MIVVASSVFSDLGFTVVAQQHRRVIVRAIAGRNSKAIWHLAKFCISVMSKGWLRDGKWLTQKYTVRYMSCMGIWGLNAQSTVSFLTSVAPALSYCVDHTSYSQKAMGGGSKLHLGTRCMKEGMDMPKPDPRALLFGLGPFLV